MLAFCQRARGRIACWRVKGLKPNVFRQLSKTTWRLLCDAGIHRRLFLRRNATPQIEELNVVPFTIIAVAEVAKL
jgi:hypothetical protein